MPPLVSEGRRTRILSSSPHWRVAVDLISYGLRQSLQGAVLATKPRAALDDALENRCAAFGRSARRPSDPANRGRMKEARERGRLSSRPAVLLDGSLEDLRRSGSRNAPSLWDGVPQRKRAASSEGAGACRKF